MSNYSEDQSQQRRREILLLLAADAGYTCNEALLRTLVNQRGVTTSRDQLRSELAWLHEQRLIDVREVADMQVASISGRGLDVASGVAVVPGVWRVEPGRAL